MKKVSSLIVWIVGLQLVGFAIGHLIQGSIPTWYLQLPQAPLSPPYQVFSIAWITLYVLIAVAGWYLWSHASNAQFGKAKVTYVLQMLFNWSWSPIFFTAHAVTAAFIVLCATTLFTIATIAYTWRDAKTTAYLLIPYALWLCFAAYLNGYILLDLG